MDIDGTATQDKKRRVRLALAEAARGVPLKAEAQPCGARVICAGVLGISAMVAKIGAHAANRPASLFRWSHAKKVEIMPAKTSRVPTVMHLSCVRPEEQAEVA